MMNLVRLLIPLLFFVTKEAIFGNASALDLDARLAAWREETPKKSNMVTVLVGDCSAHRKRIDGVYYDWPIIQIDGGPGLHSRLTQLLQRDCKEEACPSMTLFINRADLTPVREIREIATTCFFKQNCATPDFGGLNKECSRVWFALSTCFGRNLTDSLANELEGQLVTEEEVSRAAQYEMRRTWPDSRISNGALRVVMGSRKSFSHFELVKAYIDRKKADLAVASTTVVLDGGGAPVPDNKARSFIDLSVFNSTKSGYFGQDWARQAVHRALKAVQKNLKTNRGPLVFFFLGPAGTGKTMLAKLVARAYHGDKELSVIESEGGFRIFAMASYKSEENVDAFVSPRAGLVGEGSMVDLFRKSTRPVVVLDEIEKAHPKLISEMLLAWIDDNEGFVQDKKDAGRRYSTKDAIFILTSNCFSETVTETFRSSNGDINRVSNEVLKILKGTGGKDEQQHHRNCNAFKREEVQRRLKAGHAIADLQDFGFVIFTPPTLEQVDQITRFFLHDYQMKHRMGGFYWTDRALTFLEKLARRASLAGNGSGGLSQIQSTLSGAVTRVLRTALEDCELSPDSDVLLLEQDGQLVANIVNCTNDRIECSASETGDPPEKDNIPAELVLASPLADLAGSPSPPLFSGPTSDDLGGEARNYDVQRNSDDETPFERKSEIASAELSSQQAVKVEEAQDLAHLDGSKRAVDVFNDVQTEQESSSLFEYLTFHNMAFALVLVLFLWPLVSAFYQFVPFIAVATLYLYVFFPSVFHMLLQALYLAAWFLYNVVGFLLPFLRWIYRVIGVGPMLLLLFVMFVWFPRELLEDMLQQMKMSSHHRIRNLLSNGQD